MAVPEYVNPIQLTKATQDWISKMNGAIQHARNHPDTNQRGYNPEFWQRLKAKDIKSIPSGQYQASHKMGYMEADGKYYVYPSVQEIDGKLVDLSDNDELAFKTALKNNNFIVAPSEEIAENFSKYYKQSKTFPGFQKFNPISNIRYNNIVMNNKQRVFSLYNKFMKEGYSPEQAAGIIGNLVIEGELNENSKETNGKGEGLAQWTTEARKQAMYAHPRVLFDSEFDAQSDFLTKELQDKNVWARAGVNKTGFEQQRIPYKNPSAKLATTYFMKGYENPKSSASHEKDRQEVTNYIMSPEFQTEYQAQLLYKKEGGEMNYINYYKSGSGIHIKKANKGKFTDYCGGKVTSECIARGKHSSSAAVRKRATFAANARKWKHEDGGILKAAWGDSVVKSTTKAKERLKKLFTKESDFDEIKNPFEQEQVIPQASSTPGTLTWDDLNAAFDTPIQTPQQSSVSTSNNDRMKLAINYLVSKGLSKAGAAGAVGVFFAESGLTPGRTNEDEERKYGDKAGKGIAQWSNERRKGYDEYMNGKSGTLEDELDYFLQEVATSRPKVLDVLKNASDVNEAVQAMHLGYENGTAEAFATPEQLTKIYTPAWEKLGYGKYNYQDSHNKRYGYAQTAYALV